MTRFLRTLSGFLGATWIALAGTVLIVVLGVHVLPVTGHQLVVIRGASMAPSIPSGSVVIVGAREPDGIREGDVVTAQTGSGMLFTHRVTEVIDREGSLFYRTKGDASASPDPVLVPADAIVGAVDVHVPLVGYLVLLLGLPVGVLTVLSLLLTLVVAGSLLDDLAADRAPAQPVSPDPGRTGAHHRPAKGSRRAGLPPPTAARPTRSRA